MIQNWMKNVWQLKFNSKIQMDVLALKPYKKLIILVFFFNFTSGNWKFDESFDNWLSRELGVENKKGTQNPRSKDGWKIFIAMTVFASILPVIMLTFNCECIKRFWATARYQLTTQEKEWFVKEAQRVRVSQILLPFRSNTIN